MSWLKFLKKDRPDKERPSAKSPEPQEIARQEQPERPVAIDKAAAPRPGIEERRPVVVDDEKLARRSRRAAESLLENESLTADLDDAAAKVLIDWGIACAKAAAQGTAGLDDDQAETEMDTRLRATRKLMRSVNKWVAGYAEMDEESQVALLARMQEQVAAIYGPGSLSPDFQQLRAFVEELAQTTGGPEHQMSSAIVARLRALLESDAQTL